MQTWIVRHVSCSLSRATGEKQQGFIYLMMTNTSPEKRSRKSTNGTIKLVTKGTVVLDILIKLTVFTAKIPSAATQGCGSSLPGIWTSVFFASLCLSYCFSATGWYFTLLRNQLIILLQAWGFSGSEHLPLGKLKGPMLWQICVALTFSVIYLGPISSPLTFLIDRIFLMQFPSWSQNATFRIPFAEKSWRNCGSSLGWPTIFICPGPRGFSGCRTVHAETWIVLGKPSCAGPVFMSCPSQLSQTHLHQKNILITLKSSPLQVPVTSNLFSCGVGNFKSANTSHQSKWFMKSPQTMLERVQRRGNPPTLLVGM